MHVTVLAGGVGAARFLDGLVRVVPPGDVTVIGNVADDFEHLGLHVSPDLDTVLYTLAGLVHEGQGWGRADETGHALDTVRSLGGPGWFFLGDRDIGLHLVRAERLRAGEPLSSIAQDFAERFGAGVHLLPATDDPVRTMLRTAEGWLDFQTYFVRRRHADEVLELAYRGAADAAPAPGVVEAVEGADLVIVAPSNPYLSIDPITAVEGVAAALARRAGPTLAVSPVIGGTAVKGPAAALMRRFAGEASPGAVARHYAPWLTHLLVDSVDAAEVPDIAAEQGIHAAAADTLMAGTQERIAVARAALELASRYGE
jgi:LPPG:FO 2-phospho-L-lactate transferase